MSDFTDFMAVGMEEMFAVLGTTDFKIEGRTFQGDFDQFSAEKNLDVGGFSGTYTAVIVAQLAPIAAAFPAPLEKAIEGKRLLISGRDLRIERAVLDAISITLYLVNPNKSGK